MQIASTQYSGKHRALEIYVSGCSGPHCPGCHNSEIWDFENGTLFDETMAKFILTKVHLFDKMIDRIWVLGGEPLDQNIGCLQYLIRMLNRTGKELWLFTGKDFRDVPESILAACNYVKCGRFECENTLDAPVQYGVQLASANQKIFKRGFDY